MFCTRAPTTLAPSNCYCIGWKQPAFAGHLQATRMKTLLSSSKAPCYLRHSARLGVLAAVISLAGCTNMAQTPPGTALSVIQSEYGAPNYRCTTETGQERVIWSQQPFGQYAWGANITPDGRAESVELVLSDAYIQRLAQGTWTPEQVRCAFGPPAKIELVGMPSVRETVWSYRYKESGVWNSLMYIYFGTDGKKVTRFHPGPDPLFDRDRFWVD